MNLIKLFGCSKCSSSTIFTFLDHFYHISFLYARQCCLFLFSLFLNFTIFDNVAPNFMNINQNNQKSASVSKKAFNIRNFHVLFKMRRFRILRVDTSLTLFYSKIKHKNLTNACNEAILQCNITVKYLHTRIH